MADGKIYVEDIDVLQEVINIGQDIMAIMRKSPCKYRVIKTYRGKLHYKYLFFIPNKTHLHNLWVLIEEIWPHRVSYTAYRNFPWGVIDLRLSCGAE